MNPLRRFFDWAVCGYTENCRGFTFCNGWRIGTATRRGWCVFWMLDRVRALRAFLAAKKGAK